MKNSNLKYEQNELFKLLQSLLSQAIIRVLCLGIFAFRFAYTFYFFFNFPEMSSKASKYLHVLSVLWHIKYLKLILFLWTPGLLREGSLTFSKLNYISIFVSTEDTWIHAADVIESGPEIRIRVAVEIRVMLLSLPRKGMEMWKEIYENTWISTMVTTQLENLKET